MEALVDRGHNLTVVTQDKDTSRANLTYVLLENVYPMLFKDGATNYVEMSKESAFRTVFSFLDYYNSVCEGVCSTHCLIN